MNKRIPGFIHIAESLHLARTRWRKGGATLQDLLRLRVDWKRKLWQRRERDALLERRQVRKRAAMEGKCSAAVNKEEEFLRSLGRYRIEEYLAPSPFGEHIGIRVVFEKPGREKEVIRDPRAKARNQKGDRNATVPGDRVETIPRSFRISKIGGPHMRPANFFPPKGILHAGPRDFSSVRCGFGAFPKAA